MRFPTKQEPGVIRARRLVLLSLGLALVGAGCRSKPPTTSSLTAERAMTGDASRKMSEGMKLLMESIDQPAGGFHFSYKAQKNVNPNYPRDEKAKPEIGPVEIEADISPDEIVVTETKGTKKNETKAKKSDQLGWPMAQLALTGTLLDPSFALAFGGAVARPAGSENLGTTAADKYEFDTATASAAARAGFQIASSVLGGKVKFTAVKGTAWVDQATGRLVKFNIDSELSDQAGNSWKEHQEAGVTPK